MKEDDVASNREQQMTCVQQPNENDNDQSLAQWGN